MHVMLLLAETMSVGGFFSALWKFFVGLFGLIPEYPFIFLLIILLIVILCTVHFKGHDSSNDFVDC